MRWKAFFDDRNLLHIDGIGMEESGAEIVALKDGTFDLYEITQYGNATLFDSNQRNLYDAINKAEEWT